MHTAAWDVLHHGLQIVHCFQSFVLPLLDEKNKEQTDPGFEILLHEQGVDNSLSNIFLLFQTASAQHGPDIVCCKFKITRADVALICAVKGIHLQCNVRIVVFTELVALHKIATALVILVKHL